jgi:hypothetical protein
MITLKKNDPGKPIETTMTLAGEGFPITLLPMLLRDQVVAFAQFRKRKNVPNPVSGKMEMMDYFDDKDEGYLKVADDLLEKHVIDFHGIGLNPGEELDGTLRENKLLLGSVKVEDVEEVKILDPDTKEVAIILRPRMRYFRNLIFDKCSELAETIAETETKN